MRPRASWKPPASSDRCAREREHNMNYSRRQIPCRNPQGAPKSSRAPARRISSSRVWSVLLLRSARSPLELPFAASPPSTNACGRATIRPIRRKPALMTLVKTRHHRSVSSGRRRPRPQPRTGRGAKQRIARRIAAGRHPEKILCD